MAAEQPTNVNEYIVHHLTNLTRQTGDGAYLRSQSRQHFLLGARWHLSSASVSGSRRVRQRRLSPASFQNFVEWARSKALMSRSGTRSMVPSRLIAPLALTIFLPSVPLQFHGSAASAGLAAMDRSPRRHRIISRSYRAPTSTSPSACRSTVFLLVMYYSIRIKGAGGFAKELLFQPVRPVGHAR